MGTIIVGAIVLIVIGLAVGSVVRDRKRGGCAGCPSSGSGKCPHCK